MKMFFVRFFVSVFLSSTLFFDNVFAVVKTSAASGLWSNASNWNPVGVPAASDDVTIQAMHKMTMNVDGLARSLTVNNYGELSFSSAKKLTLNGALSISGKLDMNGGDIVQQLNAAPFIITNTGIFTWNPADNSVAGASLFLKSVENFSAASTLIIKKWYSYTTVPLGSVVTGNFGNVSISTLVGSTLFEWNQNNQFQSHKILGTLSIDQGWIVLDKSGQISNTFIGSIKMVNMNSVLDFHSGTHPSSFIVNTDSIINTGGEINGIFNGNGNVSLNVTHSFTNMGNVELIYNAGVANVGNGNAVLNVGGKYKQTHGDLRGVFNLSTTNAGSSTMTFGSVELTGGLMMGFYACNTSSGLNKIVVNGDLNISLSNANDKFRVNGLTTLAGQFCNSKSELHVKGNLSLSGLSSAEFTSSGSVGAENVLIEGDLIINGLNNNFNFGSHATSIQVNGKMQVAGGYTCLSRFPGTAQVILNGDVLVSTGSLAVKGSTGSATVNVNGNYIQTGGTFLFHNNSLLPTSDDVSVSVNGMFNQQNGVINYDDNVSATAIHSLNIKGSLFNVDGASSITRAGGGNALVFGKLNFSAQGIVNYKRNSSTASLQQVKQVVSSGCNVNMLAGNFLLSSHSTPSLDFLTVSPGGVLQMNSTQIVSDGKYSCTGFRVESQGKITTANSNGFYNASGSATIKSSGKFNFYLDDLSMVEYNGIASQIITGIGEGIATGNQHKYGQLIINQSGNSLLESSYLKKSDVFVRNKLILKEGGLRLNNCTLTIESGDTSTVQRVNGFLFSETSTSIIKWKNVGPGSYLVPFGETNNYLPCELTVKEGKSDVDFFSYRTSLDNLPLPNAVSTVKVDDVNVSASLVADRWFGINATGLNADINFSYAPNENAVNATEGDSLQVISYQDKIWRKVTSYGTVKANTESNVNATNINSFGVFGIVLKNGFRETYFNLSGSLYHGVAQLNWQLSDDTDLGTFTIERSADGINFNPISEQEGNSTGTYASADAKPFSNTNFYRIKRISPSQKERFSNELILADDPSIAAEVSITAIFPNPFHDAFQVTYFLKNESLTTCELLNAQGVVVMKQSKQCENGVNSFRFDDNQNISNGVYIIRITANGTTLTRRIIKQ